MSLAGVVTNGWMDRKTVQFSFCDLLGCLQGFFQTYNKLISQRYHSAPRQFQSQQDFHSVIYDGLSPLGYFVCAIWNEESTKRSNDCSSKSYPTVCRCREQSYSSVQTMTVMSDGRNRILLQIGIVWKPIQFKFRFRIHYQLSRLHIAQTCGDEAAHSTVMEKSEKTC